MGKTLIHVRLLYRSLFIVLVASFMLLGFHGYGQARAAGSIYYVDPRKGNDSNPGSLVGPWKSLAASVLKLQPGDTLYLRGGTYWEDNIRVGVEGSPEKPISIKNYLGETAVVDGGFREFRKVPNSDWEVVDPARAIYRSQQKYVNAQYAYGFFGQDNGNFRLISYEKYGNISTNNQNYADGDTYIGPGVFYNSSDEKIYVRLQQSKYEPLMGYNIPRHTDPGQTSMSIFPNGCVICFTENAAYLKIEGIDFRFRNNALEYQSGSHHITLTNSKVLGGRAQILIRQGAHDLVFDRVSILDAVPPWMPRSDVKRPKSNAPGHRMQGTGFALVGEVYNVEIKNSEVRNAFDAIDATENPHGLHIHHNEFTGIRDDGFQMGSGGYDIEVNNNRMIHVSCGISWNGSGSPPPGNEGTKYIHHNIIDASGLSLYIRSDPSNTLDLDKGSLGPADDGIAAHRAIGMHGREKITGPDPWKIYQNTFVVTQDYTTDRGVDCAYFIEPYNRNHPHEIYNNIFIQVADHWVAQDARVQDGSQIFDGNLYWRTVSNPQKPLFKSWRDGRNKKSFQSLAEFKNSNYYLATKSYYPPGWESSGVEADPQLDKDYRPAPNSPATNGAIRLPAGFPGNDGGIYRGALPPRK